MDPDIKKRDYMDLVIFIKENIRAVLKEKLTSKFTKTEIWQLLEIIQTRQFIPSDMVPIISEAFGFGICVIQPSLTCESELVLTNGRYDPFSPVPVLAKDDCMVYIYFNGGDEFTGG